MTTRRWAHLAAAATLGVLVWRVGTGPFLDGLRAVDGRALAAASGLAVLTTVCCAWRWRTVAGGLGVELPLRTAVAAYYRSLFLNVTLPGGVVGDVHRGISHGRESRDVGLGLRAVAWERSAGQAVQILLTHRRAAGPAVARPRRSRRSWRWPCSEWRSAPRSILRSRPGRHAPGGSRSGRGCAAPPAANFMTPSSPAGRGRRSRVASTLVVAGHAVTFVIAARTAGATAPPDQLLPLALLVLLGAALPNIGGWGPREGVTAWAFAAAGLGASLGVATAVVYGVMVFVASLPGAAVLLVTWVRRDA